MELVRWCLTHGSGISYCLDLGLVFISIFSRCLLPIWMISEPVEGRVMLWSWFLPCWQLGWWSSLNQISNDGKESSSYIFLLCLFVLPLHLELLLYLLSACVLKLMSSTGDTKTTEKWNGAYFLALAVMEVKTESHWDPGGRRCPFVHWSRGRKDDPNHDIIARWEMVEMLASYIPTY